MDPVQHYRDRMRDFEAQSVAPGGLAFVGSSHVEWFDTDQLLPNHRIVNRGIASDRLDVDGRGVFHRLDISVFGLQPAYVMLESGTNDLGELWRNGRPTVTEIVAMFRSTVRTIRDRLPDVPMDLVSVFPTRDGYAGMSHLAKELNPFVAQIAAQFGCGYIELFDQLVDADGLLGSKFTDDGLHLNATGYALWAAALRPRLAALAVDDSYSPASMPKD